MSQEGNRLYRLHLAMIVVVNLNKKCRFAGMFPARGFCVFYRACTILAAGLQAFRVSGLAGGFVLELRASFQRQRGKHCHCEPGKVPLVEHTS